jgi:antitoxin component of MazEF toxin-antitoxin module
MKYLFFILLVLPFAVKAQTETELNKKISDSLTMQIPKAVAKSIIMRSGDSILVAMVNAPGDTASKSFRFMLSDKADSGRSYTKAAADLKYQLGGSYILSTDTGRAISQKVTGYTANKIRDSLQTNITAVVTTAAAKLNTASPVATGVATFPAVKYGRRAVADVNATLAVSDYLLAFTSMSAARTITLPAASTAPNQFFILKDESGSASIINFISLVGTVDAAVNPTIITIGRGVYRLYSNGVAWFTW